MFTPKLHTSVPAENTSRNHSPAQKDDHLHTFNNNETSSTTRELLEKVFLGKHVEDSSVTSDSNNFGFYTESSVKPWDFNPPVSFNNTPTFDDEDSQ